MIASYVSSGAIVFVLATGILSAPAPAVNFISAPANTARNPVNIFPGLDGLPPTFFSMPINFRPGAGMPNFNQDPKNIADLLNMLEKNAELSPDTRSAIVSDLLRSKHEQKNLEKRERPTTVTHDPLEKKSEDTPNKKRKMKEFTSPKDNVVPKSSKPEAQSVPSGYEEEEEYHTEEKHAKEEERVISIPISVPVHMAASIKDMLPSKMNEPKIDSKPATAKTVQQPAPNRIEAKIALVEKNATKSPAKEKQEVKRETYPKNKQIKEPGRLEEVDSQVKDKLASKDGSISALPSDAIANIFNDFNSNANKPQPEAPVLAPVQDRVTQTERRVPSVSPPNPALLVTFLENIVPKLQSLDSPQQDKFVEKENKLNSMPPKIADILDSFETMLNDSRDRVQILPQNRSSPIPLRSGRRPANIAISPMRSFDSTLNEPRQETVTPVTQQRRELPSPVPEPVAEIINAILEPEARPDEPREELEYNETDSESELEEKKILQIMYVKHMTFKMQIHMKVWHMFFAYIARDPDAANDCTVILSHVSKFYKQLTIDVEIVQKFRVLYKVVRMMTHNDQNLETFFEKTAKQPPKVDFEKIRMMKNIQNMEKWQNEMVADLWKDAMSHFDDKLEHVEKFFKDVLANHERGNSVQSLLPSVPQRNAEYLEGRSASESGNRLSIIDTEITQIRVRRKILRDPNPSFLQSALNEGFVVVKQI